MKLSLLILLILSISSNAFGKTVARVLEVNGNAFVFLNQQGPKKLFYGDQIEDMSEVMVDDMSSISLKDEQGRIFHISGGSYVKVFNNLLELKNGNIWVSSTKNFYHGVVSTVNSIAKYKQGQFIYSFDNFTGKSQILVITGEVGFSNVLQPNLNVEVAAGHFSFVDHATANGLPRGATRVGLSSYKKVKSLFHNVKALEKTNFDQAIFKDSPTSKRSIASITIENQQKKSFGKKGKLIFVDSDNSHTSRSIASAKNDSAYNYYTEYTQMQKKPKRSKLNPSKTVAPVRMFGFKTGSMSEEKSIVSVNIIQPVIPPVKSSKAIKRVPAAIESKQLIKEINSSGAFEKSLQQAIDVNTRHPQEVNQLINELKSYGQSYQGDY